MTAVDNFGDRNGTRVPAEITRQRSPSGVLGDPGAQERAPTLPLQGRVGARGPSSAKITAKLDAGPEKQNGRDGAALLPVEGSAFGDLRRERARAAAEALGAIGLGAAVLDVTGSPLAANALFDALVPDILRCEGSRIVLADPAAHALFVKAFMHLAAASGAEAASIPLRDRAGRGPKILHLLPLRGTASDASPAGLILLTIVPVRASPRALATATLRGLFDLSRAEARVARRIARGFTVDAIADDLAISRETVRCQLKSVLAKTGAKRQLDLAVLLSGPRIPGYGKNRAVNNPLG